MLKDEINKLKKRIDELEQQLKSCNKINKEKEKTIEDLSKKLTNSLKQVRNLEFNFKSYFKS